MNFLNIFLIKIRSGTPLRFLLREIAPFPLFCLKIKLGIFPKLPKKLTLKIF